MIFTEKQEIIAHKLATISETRRCAKSEIHQVGHHRGSVMVKNVLFLALTEGNIQL